ncbi:MAG: type II toxin-antitoxin system RelB/DinJ family antitoxin [Desulfobacterales bacterium]|nr:type II toxin-antitoxin system RelB/DinJ family antitoxin [Desulfobacterales bacterium]
MMASTMIHIRIDEQVKTNAMKTLTSMGLTISDAVRIMLIRIAAEKTLPFNIRVPNIETVKAIKELEEGRGKRFINVEALMDELNEDD